MPRRALGNITLWEGREVGEGEGMGQLLVKQVEEREDLLELDRIAL